MTVFTVTIIEKQDYEMEPWVSSFSSRENAEGFKGAVEAKLREYGMDDQVSVSIDSGELDSEKYLDWVDSCWGPEKKEE